MTATTQSTPAAANGRFYCYTRFERVNHWLQALLVLTLLLTGFELHGTFGLLGYKKAHELHIGAGIGWFVLFCFGIFWLATTGEWKQYTPTARKLLAVMRHYTVGIFKGEPHPVPKQPGAKHNPLQRLTYLGVVSALLPFQMVTGFLYYTYNDWAAWGLALELGTAAALHTAGAFLALTFLVVHVYMTTTGHSLFCHLKAMCTGWEEGHCPTSK